MIKIIEKFFGRFFKKSKVPNYLGGKRKYIVDD